MSDRSEKLKAGIFVLVAAFFLAAIMLLVAGVKLFKSTTKYHVLFKESVTGLEPSSVVRYYGVAVGRVEAIELAKGPARIDVTIGVRPGVPIETDTVAVLKPKGITGIYYIDLSQGTGNGQPLAPGGVIRAGPSVTVRLMETLADFGSVVKHMNELIENNQASISLAVKEIAASARGFSASLDKLNGALESTSELAADLRTDLSAAIGSAKKTIDAVRKLVQDPRVQAIPGKVGLLLDHANAVTKSLGEKVAAADVKGAIDKFGTLVDRMSKLEQEIGATIGEIRSGISENRGSVLRMTSDLKQFAENLKMLSREILDQPSRLFFGDEPRSTKEGR